MTGMAFEKSTPLARPSRDPVERPSHIPRGVMDVIPIADEDAQVTFDIAEGDFCLTYHNAQIITCERTGRRAAFVTPETTVTWERYRG